MKRIFCKDPLLMAFSTAGGWRGGCRQTPPARRSAQTNSIISLLPAIISNSIKSLPPTHTHACSLVFISHPLFCSLMFGIFAPFSSFVSPRCTRWQKSRASPSVEPSQSPRPPPIPHQNKGFPFGENRNNDSSTACFSNAVTEPQRPCLHDLAILMATLRGRPERLLPCYRQGLKLTKFLLKSSLEHRCLVQFPFFTPWKPLLHRYPINLTKTTYSPL